MERPTDELRGRSSYRCRHDKHTLPSRIGPSRIGPARIGRGFDDHVPSTSPVPDIDFAAVEAFAGQVISDFAGAATTAMTVIGDRLGLFDAIWC